jgi:hypothetical protein
LKYSLSKLRADALAYFIHVLSVWFILFILCFCSFILFIYLFIY